MKVMELIERTNKEDFNLELLLDVKKYVPIMDKKRLAIDVIATCTDDIDGFITVDRLKMYVYFDMQILNAYTNLEVATDFNEMVTQYDALCENGIRDKIVHLFENDYEVMCVVLEDMLEELLVQNSIDMQVVRVANRVMNILDVLEDKMDDMNSLIPEGTDMNQLLDMINILK